MNKVYKPTDVQQKESHELSKKLYRTISEHAKLLDNSRSCVRNISGLFAPSFQAQRRKFCDYCDRLIFSQPILYGRKVEELLWRKAFYEIISTAKKLKKKDYTDEEICHIQSHINAGIGFYHHLLLKFNLQFNIPLQNTIDCSMVQSADNSTTDLIEIGTELKDYAKQSVHQCLIYLGDLSRYKIELNGINNDSTGATRYYLQAITFRPDFGMPHNQMGTMAMNQNNFLDAVYHYLRCLTCKVPFEGTANNLQNLFEKNAKFIEQLPQLDDDDADCIIEPEKAENIKRFIARFLLLIDIWYFNKKVPNVYSLCHQTYKNLEECLAYAKPTASVSGESPTNDSESIETDSSYLTGQMIFRVILICLLSITKLHSTNSPSLSTLIAFTLGIYSQIIQKMSRHIEEAVLNYPLTEDNKKVNGVLKEIMNVGKKKSKSVLRRRKPLKLDSDEDSDMSENENDTDYSSSDDDDSFISDNDDIIINSSDEETDIIKAPNNALISENAKSDLEVEKKLKSNNFILKKVQKMDATVTLEIINEEGLMQSIKIINDWLKSDQEIIKSCALNTKTLIRQMIHLINLMNINLNSLKSLMSSNLRLFEIIKNENQIPLAEDVILKGIKLLHQNNEYNWNYLYKRNICAKEESIIRVVKLLSFGTFLSKIEETSVRFDDEKNIFICTLEDGKEENKAGISASTLMEELERKENCTPSKTLLVNGESKFDYGNNINKMKHMGQLWLAAEVQDLESRVSSTKMALSPYLVLDADALIKYTYMVKQLVFSRQFILIVPAAVVSALDDLKKEKIEARDAIRWLESQFHKGNRFFRAQRPQERTPIPFVKYPKKKDKEMHIFIQIIECCHYFAEQQKGASNVVTFLLGSNHAAALSNGENKDFSYAGLAKSAGIVLEAIRSFHGKWKKSKGNRNKEHERKSIQVNLKFRFELFFLCGQTTIIPKII